MPHVRPYLQRLANSPLLIALLPAVGCSNTMWLVAFITCRCLFLVYVMFILPSHGLDGPVMMPGLFNSGLLEFKSQCLCCGPCGGNFWSNWKQDSERHEERWSFDGKHWWFIWSYGRRIDKTGGVSRVDTAVAKPILKNSSAARGFNSSVIINILYQRD